MDKFGEYWITDTGNILFADGDVCDYNHENYVIEIVQKFIMEHFNYFDLDWETFKTIFHENKLKELTKRFPKREQWFDNKYIKDPELYFFEPYLKKEGFDEEITIANGSGDARAFAMKEWGWKRFASGNIESWTLTIKDLEIITKGINNIIDEEGCEDFDDENEVFYISSYKGRLRSFTLRELENGGAKSSMSIDPVAAANIATEQIKIMDKQLQHPVYNHLGD